MSSTSTFNREQQTNTRPSSQQPTTSSPSFTLKRTGEPPSRPRYGSAINQGTLQPLLPCTTRISHQLARNNKQLASRRAKLTNFTPQPTLISNLGSHTKVHSLDSATTFRCTYCRQALAAIILAIQPAQSLPLTSSYLTKPPPSSHPRDLPLRSGRKIAPTTCTRNLISLFWLHLWLHLLNSTPTAQIFRNSPLSPFFLFTSINQPPNSKPATPLQSRLHPIQPND